MSVAVPPESPIVICLGNPGQRYAATRHNLGWWVADLLVGAPGHFLPGWGKFEYAVITCSQTSATIIKPLTYMNLSGHALVDFAARYPVSPERVTAIVDDIALPLGQLRIRASGSDGGHNGLASLIESLGSEEFARVRCGVGPVPDGVDPAEFVLAPFPENELSLAREMAVRAAAAVRTMLTDGVAVAANTYNRKPPAPDSLSGDEAGADRPREGT
jgi:PTH1 family peptidyl-tRNA hydrolase